MAREVNALRAVVDEPTRRLVAVLGGARLGEKVGVVRRFLELADVVCIGGGMCFPFLAALGHNVGQSLCSREDVGRARTALIAAAGSTDRLVLPDDLQLVRWGNDDGAVRDSLDGVDVPNGWMGLDIGARTAARYAEAVLTAATVFWNGPMGRFELPQFAGGTRVVAQAVASTSATTVVGGGETVDAVRQFGPRREREPRLDRRPGHARVPGGTRATRGGGTAAQGARSGTGGRRAGPRSEWPRRAPDPYAGAFWPQLSFAFSWSSFASTAALSCSRWRGKLLAGFPLGFTLRVLRRGDLGLDVGHGSAQHGAAEVRHGRGSMTSGLSSLTTASSAVRPT